ncbi:MAG: helix-turn-helix domain-containing protein [Clostridia bacterium]|nr:helix-turn-helix domain-containing protein [Clostridia bacterium]
MDCANHYDLLRRFLTKCRINFCVLPDELNRADMGLRDILSLSRTTVAGLALAELKNRCLYALHDGFCCTYLLFRQQDKTVCIGPYLSREISEAFILETAEKWGASPMSLSALRRYYAALPLLDDNSAVFVMVHTYLEEMWGDGYAMEELSPSAPREPAAKNTDHGENSARSRWLIDNIEQRYEFENRLMEAVQTGQTGKLQTMLRGIRGVSFVRRATEEVRDMKNYCIIVNTLLRKAAEKGGVHPYHVDRISSGFATRIEAASSLKQIPKLIEEMLYTYCRSVRKYANEHHSPPVQKALLYIEASLSGELSLSKLAHEININPSYLSELFKKETGTTLTEYINKTRINRACRMLRETTLQVQTVAQYCGIQDVNYFSKVFKKYTGQTPSEYRRME